MKGPFRQHGKLLINNGYAIIPIPPGTKGPRFEGWQDKYAKDHGTYEGLAADSASHGIGIITKHNPAVDIDCLDGQIVDLMVQWCRKHIGVAPLRIGRAPKALLLYRTDEPFRKVTSARYFDPEHPDRDPKRKGQRLEILGEGQQFVAYHIHPETGKPYVWPGDWESPIDVASDELPLITEAQAEAACRHFEWLCESAGWERLGAGSSSAPAENAVPQDDALGELDPPDETEGEVDRVKSALDAMKSVASDYDYDQWRNVLFALKWTKWDCAESLARDWSESSDKHVTKEFNVVWRGAQKRDRGKEITLATLFKMAKDAGWDASRSAGDDSAETFEELMRKVDELEFTDNTRKAVHAIVVELANAGLSAASEGQILKAIKKTTGDSIGDMRRDMNAARKKKAADEKNMATHSSYAVKLMSQLEDKTGVPPVGVEGLIYTYSTDEGIWKGKLPNNFSVDVAKAFDGQENCTRRADYTAIAQHMYELVSIGNEEFFNDSPIGLACKGRFYLCDHEGHIEREELDHTHRQRVLSKVRPVVGVMPRFEKFLDETFAGDVDSEQRTLLQEIMGAVLLGLTAKHEKVIMLKGPGRSGKSTMMKVIESMLPPEFRAAVSPFKWDSEYYLANLAGKRLNAVGELPDDQPIPAADFKALVGRDFMTARHPTHRPFNFRNEATHIFNTNHFVYTKDHTEAFYSRWILMEFPNSLIGKESDQTTNLAELIVKEEMPAILAWALQGAKRLEARGYFKTTGVQKKLMAQWRHRTNTLIEFLLDKDVCRLGDGKEFIVRRSVFYQQYTQWCKDSNRRPTGKMRLYDELESHAVFQLGISKGFGPEGHDIVRGISFVDAGWGVDLDEKPDKDDDL